MPKGKQLSQPVLPVLSVQAEYTPRRETKYDENDADRSGIHADS